MCSKCKKLSLKREVLHEIWTIFRPDIAKRMSGNLAVESMLKFAVFSKLKSERNFNRQVQNVTGPEKKHVQLQNARPLCTTTNLDANWNALTGLYLAFYRQQPYKSFTVNLQFCLL